MKTHAWMVGLALLQVAALAAAQPAGRNNVGNSASNSAGNANNGSNNVDLGATLARQGAGAVPACVGCHGERGEGQAAAGFPRIGGQAQTYLRRQLDAYAQGFRRNAVMEPIAKQMTEQQRDAASRYYASLLPASDATAAQAAQAAQTSAATPAADAASAARLLARGRQLAEDGDERRQVQACANCHAPGGGGSAPNYPALAGQHAAYTLQALTEWKDGSRRTDASRQMPQIAQRLQPDDMQAVAAYYASQPVPRPLDSVRAAPAGVPGRVAVVSGPRPGPQGQPAPSGVGTEQGSPVQGGSQFGSDPRSGTGTPGASPGNSGAGGPAASSPATGASAPQRRR